MIIPVRTTGGTHVRGCGGRRLPKSSERTESRAPVGGSTQGSKRELKQVS